MRRENGNRKHLVNIYRLDQPSHHREINIFQVDCYQSDGILLQLQTGQIDSPCRVIPISTIHSQQLHFIC